MANIDGKAYGFTAFTPIGRRRTIGVRLAFLLIRIAQIKLVSRIFRAVSLIQAQQRLVDLSFIHFARWVIVPRDSWPRLAASQPAETLGYDYLLFCSNFNGDWEQYIDAFSAVIPGGMNLIWRWCVKYPGAQPISPFLEYIRRNQFFSDFYYTAYPGASTTDIRGAVHLSGALAEFAARARSIPPAAFRSEFDKFLCSVQRDLATTGPAPWANDPDEVLLDGIAARAPAAVAAPVAAAPAEPARDAVSAR